MKIKPKMSYRSEEKDPLGISYRKAGVDMGDGPKTLSAEKRSVKVTAATETPVSTYDWNYGRIDEVLLMSGVVMPAENQMPLLNAHSRYDVSDIIGSARSLEVKGRKIMAEVFFSDATEDARTAFKLLREGHLKAFSIGYKIIEFQIIKENEKSEVGGKMFKGPAKIVTKWSLHELSAVPIGADKNATARAEEHTEIEKQAEPVPAIIIKKEEEKMDPKLRAFLEARGMQKGLSDEDALKWASENMEAKAEKPGITEDQLKAAEEAGEKRALKRAGMLDSMVRAYPELDDSFKIEMMTGKFDNAAINARALELIQEKSKTGEGVGHNSPYTIEKGGDERDKFRAAAQDALSMRVDLEIEKPAPGAQDLRGLSMKELCREALRVKGLNHRGGAQKMVGRALATSDFPLLIANVLHNQLQKGFETADESWQTVFDTGSVSDFKTHYESRASESDDLVLLPEGSPYTFGKQTEHQEEYSVLTYGGKMAITRQAIINDNLGFLKKIPLNQGESAARKIGDIAWLALTANANMGDGNALFSTAHANIQTTGGAVGVSTLNAGNLAMTLQKDLRGLRRLNITPSFYVGPRAVQGTSEVFFGSVNFSDASTIATDSSMASTQKNIWSGNRLAQVYESRLDTASATGWYLLGKKGTTITVFFLDGKKSPYLETRNGWDIDGVEYKVRIDAGAKAMKWESMYFNDGTP